MHRIRRDSRIGKVIALLAQPDGATLPEVAEAYGVKSVQQALALIRTTVIKEKGYKVTVDVKRCRFRIEDEVRWMGSLTVNDLVVDGLATAGEVG